MQWLSSTYFGEPPEVPPLCMGCYQKPAQCTVRLAEYRGNEHVTLDLRLCQDCDDRARQGTLDLKHGFVGK